MTAVVFDPAIFKERYPQFATLSDGLLSEYFAEATLFIANDDTSIVSDLAQRKVLLTLLVAHLAALNSGEYGQGPSGMVGRVSSATEGSVSISTEYSSNSELAMWFNQTRYGAELWVLLSKYRTFRYVPPVKRMHRKRQGWY